MKVLLFIISLAWTLFTTSMQENKEDNLNANVFLNAVIKQDTQTMKKAITAGINPNVNVAIFNPLVVAIRSEDLEFIQFLLENNADPDAPVQPVCSAFFYVKNYAQISEGAKVQILNLFENHRKEKSNHQ